jgi:hypothetical protein
MKIQHAADEPRDDLDAAVDHVIATEGDARAALRSILARSWAAETELARMRTAISWGYVRRRQVADERSDAR